MTITNNDILTDVKEMIATGKKSIEYVLMQHKRLEIVHHGRDIEIYRTNFKKNIPQLCMSVRDDAPDDEILNAIDNLTRYISLELFEEEEKTA